MAANISITIVAVVGAGVLVKGYLLHPSPVLMSNMKQVPGTKSELPDARSSLQGTQVSVAGVDWAESDETIVLALSNKCHFCTESAPFYQKLTSDLAQRKNVRVIAVFPQQIEEAKKYLDGLGVAVTDVRQATLDSIGVRGTPTLMIVDKSGTVKQAWIGRLSSEKESEVFNRIKASSL
jgi:peroxiredoxin